jgi:hypothetical protein
VLLVLALVLVLKERTRRTVELHRSPMGGMANVQRVGGARL